MKPLPAVAIGLVTGLLAASGYFLMSDKTAPAQPLPPAPPPVQNGTTTSPAPAPTPVPPTPVPPAATTKTYKNDTYKFSFEYPSLLNLERQENKIILQHSTPFEHEDPCDFQGGGPKLDRLTDFSVNMTEYPTALGETVLNLHPFGSDTEDYLNGDKLKITTGMVDEAHFGLLNGYRITQGVEGCGLYTYYFKLAPKVTLVVNRKIVTELSNAVSNSATYLSLPGIIKPAAAEKIFGDIFKSFRYEG